MVSFGLKRFGVVLNTDIVAEFAPMIRQNGQPGCSICSFFCVIQDNKNWWESLGHTNATVVTHLPPFTMILILVVPMTFIVFPSAEMHSIMLEESSCITRLCFLVKLSSMQSTEVPVSGKALSVARYSFWFYFDFTLRLPIGVG